jgi:hypothetical protein
MAIVVFGMPLVVAAVILAATGWDPQRWSPAERRGRLALSVGLGLPLAAGAVFVVDVGAWLLGPDCGQHPTDAIRLRVVLFAVAVAACAAAVPVAIAGRRRLTLIAAAAPTIAPIVAAVAAVTPNTVGWCLF